VDQHRLAALDLGREGEGLERDPRGGGLLRGHHVHLGQHLEVPSTAREEADPHDLEIESRAHRLGQAVEDVLHVEARSQRPREVLQRPQPAPAPPLPLEEHHVLDEGRDQVGHLLRRGQVGVRVGVGGQTAAAHEADDLPSGVEGHHHAGAIARCLELALDGAQGGQARIRLDVVDPHRLAVEDGAQGHLGHHVTGLRVERGRVVLEREHRAVGRVLGEYREGPAIIVQTGDGEPVVGDQPLDTGGELDQEAAGVELLLHGAADGGQGGEEIGDGRAGLVRRSGSGLLGLGSLGHLGRTSVRRVTGHDPGPAPDSAGSRARAGSARGLGLPPRRQQH